MILSIASDPNLRSEIGPLLEAGAVSEVSGCRPTRTDRSIHWETENSDNDNSSSGLLELEWCFGYVLDGEPHHNFVKFLYKDGTLYP